MTRNPANSSKTDYSRLAHIALPRVSVVLTNFNYEAYVLDALSSAVNQTYPNIEILIVDDNSNDNSWQLIGEFIANDDRLSDVKTIQLGASVGQTGAAYAGFKASSGSYVVFLDADDILMPSCVEAHVYAHLSSRLAVGFSSVDCLIIRGDEILAGKGSPDAAQFVASGEGRLPGMIRPFDEASDGLWLAGRAPPIKPDDIHFVLPPQCEPWVWSYMSGHCFRRDALNHFLKGPLEGLKTGTDGFLVKPISAMCGSMVIDKALMGYRVHGKNAFTTAVPLLRLQSYGASQIRRMVEVDKRSIAQLIENAETFALVCGSPEYFFQAIERLSLSWPLNSEHGQIGYLRHVLQEHEADLVKTFGRARFETWIGAEVPSPEAADMEKKRSLRPFRGWLRKSDG